MYDGRRPERIPPELKLRISDVDLPDRFGGRVAECQIEKVAKEKDDMIGKNADRQSDIMSEWGGRAKSRHKEVGTVGRKLGRKACEQSSDVASLPPSPSLCAVLSIRASAARARCG